MCTSLDFSICKICRISIEDIIIQEKRKGCYKTDYFVAHLQKHDLTKEEYFGEGPECPCKQCGKKLRVIKNGKVFRWSKFACGRNPGILRWSEDAKTSRVGKGNPMYGAVPWNEGLNKTNSQYGQKMSHIQTGRTVSLNTRKKQAISAKNRTKHGHTGHKHSEESKELMRQATLRRIAKNEFPQINTLPSRRFEEILRQYDIPYIKEYVLSSWSFDFYLTKHNILVEVDGDYFHSNPKIYPSGPKTKTQKINHYRDIQKNRFCYQNNYKLVRFWESDILGDQQCVVQKLQELQKSG